MRTPAPLPHPLASAPFTVADADAAGISRGRLRAKDLVNPFVGVRLPHALIEDASDDEKFHRLVDAYEAKMPKSWFFSGPTAARLMGVPLPARFEKLEVHVTSPGDFTPRGKFVIGHTARAASTSVMFDRHVRVPAEVWCELAAMLTLDELITAGDRLLSEKPILLTAHRHLEAAVAAHRRGRGVRLLRLALVEVRNNVWSPRETWVRLVLIRAGFPEPERNMRIFGADGKLIAIGDLVYPAFKIVIEYEGERWHADPWSKIDTDRFNKLGLLGWMIIRVRKHHTADDVERMVGAALLARGWRP